MTVISFAIQKGGTGKTTSAVAISGWLAEKKKKVLLIDLDPQASATECIVDTLKIRKEPSVKDLLLSNRKIEDIIRKSESYPDHLHFIPAKMVEMIADEAEGKFIGLNPFLLNLKLESVRKKYNYIICDCPPNLMKLTMSALYASDFVVMPLEPEQLAYDGLEQFVLTVFPDVNNYNQRLSLGGALIVNRATNRKYIPANIKNQIDSLRPGLRFTQEIPLDQELARMAMNNKPISAYNKGSNGSIAYRNLIDTEFMHRFPPTAVI